MKRTLAAILILCLALSLGACSGEQSQPAEEPAPALEPAASPLPQEDGESGMVELGYTLAPVELPELELSSGLTAMEGGEIYLAGWDGEGALSLAHVPMDGGDWQEIPAPEAEEGSSLAALQVDGDSLYLVLDIFGPDGSESILHLYDLAQKAWTFSGPLENSQGRYATGWCAMDGVLISASYSGTTAYSQDGMELWTAPASGFLAAVGEELYISQTDGQGQTLYRADPLTGEMTELCPLPAGIYQSYHSAQGLYLADGTGLTALTEEGQLQPLLRWADLGLDTSMGMGLLQILEDGQILLSCSNVYYGDPAELYLISSGPGQQRKELKLWVAEGTGTTFLSKAVSQFNLSQQEYLVRQEYYPADRADQLAAQVASGEGPDILYLGGSTDRESSFTQVEINDSLCVDLMPYIQADPDYGPDKFVPGVLEAMGKDGHVYGLTVGFQPIAMVVSAPVAEELDGWDQDAILALRDSLPEGAALLFQTRQEEYLRTLAIYATAAMVDYSQGTCSFDQGDFAFWLELGKDLEYYDFGIHSAAALDMGMTRIGLSYFPQGYEYRPIPGEEGAGVYAMSATGAFRILQTCSDKDGAWLFLRTLLSPQVQEMVWAFETPVIYQSLVDGLDKSLDQGSIAQEELDSYLNMLDQIQGPMGQLGQLGQIIIQESEKYYAGQCSLEDAVRSIQSRAGIYLAERA